MFWHSNWSIYKGLYHPINQPPQRKSNFVCHMQPHALNTTHHHSFQASHRALTLTNLWQRFPHKVLLAQHTLQSYELSNYINTLLHWHQPFCDLAVTGLWLCNHRLSLAVLVQTKFLVKFHKKNVSQMINVFIKVLLNHITLRSSQRVPLMSPCSPQIIGRVSLINQPPSPL